MTDLYCRSYILNPVPINLIDEAVNIKDFGVTTFRLDFRDESYEEVINILNLYINNKEFDSKDFTKGHFRRGIE
jgi:putative protease